MESTNGKAQRPTLLVVEDDEDLRQQIKWALSSDYDLREAGDRQSAIQEIQSDSLQLVIFDLGLPPNPSDATEGLRAL